VPEPLVPRGYVALFAVPAEEAPAPPTPGWGNQNRVDQAMK